ncbi:hypothetical protein ABZ746_15820 [Streptomyces sp. NPDC020096]
MTRCHRGERYAGREERRRQSSARICAEHIIGEGKKWPPLQRYLGRRESYAETHAADRSSTALPQAQA